MNISLAAAFWNSRVRRVVASAVILCLSQYPVVACCFHEAPDLGKRGSTQSAIFLREGRDDDNPQIEQSGMAASLGSLKSGTFVRIRLQDGQMIEGPIAGVDGNICRFDDVQDTAINVSGAEVAWQRKSATSYGFLVGAIVASVATIVYLNDRGAYYPEYLVGVTLGSIVGGLAGAGIGSAFPNWVQIRPYGNAAAMDGRGVDPLGARESTLDLDNGRMANGWSSGRMVLSLMVRF